MVRRLMNERRRPGVREVAAAAGVSMATVSNAINNPQVVSSITRRRVELAIEALNYVPNGLARQLRNGVGQTVGLVVLDIANPFFVRVMRGAEKRATQGDMSLLLAESNYDELRERKFLEAFRSQGTVGVLVSPIGDPNETAGRLGARGIETVLIARRSTDSRVSSVTVDDVEGGRLAVSHLVGAGRKTIAFVGGPLESPPVADRLLGARIAAGNVGARIEVLETAAQTPQDGLAMGMCILGRAPTDRPSAIFAANDLIAVGLLAALNSEPGHLVPGQIALVGYDDISPPLLPTLSISSVRQPAELIGNSACDLLLGLLDGSRRPEQIVYQPELVVRHSSLR